MPVCTPDLGATGRAGTLPWRPARNLRVIDAMILQGKRILIAGMSDRRSIGYSIAQEAQKEGAEILLTSFGRMMSITQMTAKKLDPVPEILEMDVTKASDMANAAEATAKRWDRLDGMVHSVAFAPADANATEWTIPSSLSQRFAVASAALAISDALVTSISRISGTGSSFFAVICVMLIIRPKLVSRISAPSFCASCAML